ncbi:MAG: hypothetical protein MJ000_05435 [Bacteroidales bacterium]|nr:hypothetical protein [Bacteroidales bacterium]
MSSQNNLLKAILKSEKTVFTTQSLVLLSGISDTSRLSGQMHYYVKQGEVHNPRRGIYTKAQYDEKEMACAVFVPSYISMEYVLQRAGVTFQYDDTITVVSYLNRSIDIDGKVYSFRQIRPELWCTFDGIKLEKRYAIATAERAFLDMLYLSSGDCYFDNIHPLNRDMVMQLLPLYQSKVLTERVKALLK